MLFTAKDVFLEVGFERASMDVIAARAETTKRTLYAHFENKEKLFLAVFELVRDLTLSRLKMPGEYADDTEEALVLFCARFLELLLWDKRIRMFRLSIAEAERFPDAAERFYDTVFGTAQGRLEVFLGERLKLSHKAAARIAQDLLGRILFPRFTRALFGLDLLSEEKLDDKALSAKLDLDAVRRAVAGIVPLAAH
jgi:AcrR family transcriptional regulator